MPAAHYSPLANEEGLFVDSEDEFNSSRDTTITNSYWKSETDRNGNRVYNDIDKTILNIPDTSTIQLHPKFIDQEDSSSSSPTLSGHLRKFPKERKKTLIAFICLAVGFILNSISIVLTHQKVPDRNLHPPLPDISLDNLTKHRWLNDVADVLVIICTFTIACLIVYNRYRWIVCRRVFVIVGILYSMRSITMYATVLPLANTHVYCSPKINTTLSFGQTALSVTKEVVKLILAGGLPITGKKTMCGDYIYSGHTIVFMLTYLLIREYTSRRHLALHWGSWIVAWVGMICLLISHGHYTVDVIIGYYATTRLFWIYHTFANNPDIFTKSSRNSLSEVWWFGVFKYFEGNIYGPIPKEYALPRIRRKVFPMKKAFLE